MWSPSECHWSCFQCPSQSCGNGPALCDAILWQRTCTGGLTAAQRLVWNTTKSHWVFGTCFNNQSFLCKLFYCFSKGVLFIICLRLTSFTGFEELKFACVSTGTGAIAIWWRLGSWAAHNTKHMTPSTVSPDMTSKQDPQCKRGRWAKVNVYRTYMNLQKYTCVRCSHVDCCQPWPKEWFAPTSRTVQHSATTEF